MSQARDPALQQGSEVQSQIEQSKPEYVRLVERLEGKKTEIEKLKHEKQEALDRLEDLKKETDEKIKYWDNQIAELTEHAADLARRVASEMGEIVSKSQKASVAAKLEESISGVSIISPTHVSSREMLSYDKLGDAVVRYYSPSDSKKVLFVGRSKVVAELAYHNTLDNKTLISVLESAGIKPSTAKYQSTYYRRLLIEKYGWKSRDGEPSTIDNPRKTDSIIVLPEASRDEREKLLEKIREEQAVQRDI